MKQRIKELAEQAVEETQLMMIMEYRNFASKLYEKFTELIVKECVAVMTKEDVYYGDWMSSVIKEHFGVKE